MDRETLDISAMAKIYQFVVQFNRCGGGNNVMPMRLTAASRMTPSMGIFQQQQQQRQQLNPLLSHALSTHPYC